MHPIIRLLTRAVENKQRREDAKLALASKEEQAREARLDKIMYGIAALMFGGPLIAGVLYWLYTVLFG